MPDLVPFTVDSLLPASPDARTRRALSEIERRSSVIETAAERKMEVAARLNHTAKVHLTAAVATTRQLARVEPEAEPLLRAFDVQAAGTLGQIYRRAVG